MVQELSATRPPVAQMSAIRAPLLTTALLIAAMAGPPGLAATADGAPSPGSRFSDPLSDGSAGPEMIGLPGGSFRMGSGGDEAGRSADEGPRQRVTLSRAFALARHEVTVAEFRRFVDTSGYRTDAEKHGGCFYWSGGWRVAEGKSWLDPPGFEQEDAHPVVCVSWNDATAYAGWLAHQTGKPYRLPTEAEWEFAVRDGTQTSRPWSDAPEGACEWANVADRALKERYPGDWPEHPCRDGYVHTAPAGSLKENGAGFTDLLGNVWEWTCSAYEQRYRGSEQSCAAAAWPGPRVYRGGSWYNFPDYVRSAARSASSAGFRAGILGFRVARDL